MAQQKDPVVQIGKLADLMEHLTAYERDQPQHDGTTRACVTVLDVYCATWGACGALKSTYRDILLQDVDDSKVRLKFCQVDATAILAEMKGRQGNDMAMTPQMTKRSADLLRDCMPDFWREKFEAQLGKARPFFMFYKDCKHVDDVHGVDTPHIKRIIKDLIKEKQPPDAFITNADLLQHWKDDLQANNCEVEWPEFCKAINVWCQIHPDSPPLNADETDALMAALGMQRGQPVHAKNLQEWIGDGAFDAKFREVCPGYEDRVAEERVKQQAAKEQEAARKAAGEADEAKRQEEAAAAAAEQQKQDEAKAAAEAAAASAAPSGPSHPNNAVPATAQGERVFGEDGAEDNFETGCTAGPLALDSSFTLSVWVQPAEGAAYEERDQNHLGVLGCGALGVSLMEMKACFSFSADDIAGCADALEEGKWTHIGISYDKGSRATKMYLNGEQGCNKDVTAAEVAADAPVSIGKLDRDGLANSKFHGRIRGLQIVPKAGEEEWLAEVAKAGAEAPVGEAAAAPAPAPAPAPAEGEGEAPAPAADAAPAEEPPAAEPAAAEAAPADGGDAPAPAPAEEAAAPAPAEGEAPAEEAAAPAPAEEAPAGDAPAAEGGDAPPAEGEAAPAAEGEAPAEAPAEGGEAPPAEAPAEGGEEKPAEEAPADPPAE